MRGVLRGVNVHAYTAPANPATIVRIDGTASLTITPRITVADCNFTNAPATATDILFGGTSNAAKVFFRSNTWRVFPKPSAAMSASNFAAATFTTATGNQYIGGDPAEIQFANGTGAAITAIDVSKDNVTYENVWTQASGVMAQSVEAYVDNGDYVKVTFATTQPTTRVVFLK